MSLTPLTQLAFPLSFFSGPIRNLSLSHHPVTLSSLQLQGPSQPLTDRVQKHHHRDPLVLTITTIPTDSLMVEF